MSPSSTGSHQVSPRQSQPEPETGRIEAADGERLFFRCWRGEPGRAAVVYLHGIEGHSEWFSPTAAFLAASGITVYAPDRRGAGRNTQERGHVSDYRTLIEDTNTALELASSQCPGAPIFLIANCWGAKVGVVLAAGPTPVALAGLVLTSPAVSVKVDVSLATKARIALSWLTRSRLPFDIPLTPEMFTDEPLWLDYIRQDSCRLTAATASFFVESVKLTLLARWAAGRLDMPLLLLQSGKDAIVNVEGVTRWFEKVASADKTLLVFDDAAHSLDFDCHAGAYREALVSWLVQREPEAGRA